MGEPDFDCLIVGGGPAGLTAAIYLARFHLKVRVVDAGRSRASSIPCTRNLPGFPDGISGTALIERMRAHAQKFGAAFEDGRVTRIERADDLFEVEWGEGRTATRAVLLATGVRNRRPDMDETLHDDALARGLIRYCPICDGFEVTDRRVGVIGSGAHGVAEATFLRGYTADITLIAPGEGHDLDTDDRARLDALGIATVDGPARGVAVHADCIVIESGDGHYTFDSVYPALGSDIHNELALQLGAALNEGTNCILTDTHQRTSVPGAYAAGDVVIGLDQISHAMGEGGVAATTIRNDLAKARPLKR
jgi:thioredoxin reductase (NADPH)